MKPKPKPIKTVGKLSDALRELRGELRRPSNRRTQAYVRAVGAPEYTLDEMRAMLRQDRPLRVFSSRLS